MLQEVAPTIENCLQLCISANEQYEKYLANPPKDELDIITWRVNYIPLAEFNFPEEYQYKSEVLLFKTLYEKSADFFYELMDTNERNNLTERVHISLATFPEINLFHSFLTAVAPRDVSSIHSTIINESLLHKDYLSFYIESSEVNIDTNVLSVPAVSIFISENGHPIFDSNTESKIKGQLIINKYQKIDFINEIQKLGVRVEVERVR